MNPRILPRAEVVEFAKNAVTALNSGRISSMPPAEAAEIAATLGAATDKLFQADQKVVASKAAYHAATEQATVDEADVIELLATLKFKMRGAGSAAEEYKAAGFDAPADRSRSVDPQTPTDLAANGLSNGVNELKFKGNNTPGTVNYVIEARTSTGGEPAIIGTTRKRTFEHKPVTPGQTYIYRVRAEGTRGRASAWSNEAVVYPKGG
jgi:hypothetical protein